MNMEQLYNDNYKIINGMSRTISILINVNYNEIEAQANLVFCECANKYNECIGQFSKYLSNALYFSLYAYAKEIQHDNDHFSTDADNDWYEQLNMSNTINEIRTKLSYNPDYSSIIDATFKNLSNDAQYVKNIIFDNSIPLPNKICTGKTQWTKNSLRKHLLSEGWKIKRIIHAFNEISVCVNQ